jgi:hypothetical protein
MILPDKEIRWRCNPNTLPFETTEAIQPCEEIIGQDRAIEAIRMACHIEIIDNLGLTLILRKTLDSELKKYHNDTFLTNLQTIHNNQIMLVHLWNGLC